MMIGITCFLVKGFCPLPTAKPKETFIYVETWQNGTPSKLLPLVADVSLGYVTRGVHWLLSFWSPVVPPPAQSGLKSSGWGPFYKFLCCSSVQEQMWCRHGNYDTVWLSLESPLTVLLKLRNREPSLPFPTLCE